MQIRKSEMLKWNRHGQSSPCVRWCTLLLFLQLAVQVPGSRAGLSQFAAEGHAALLLRRTRGASTDLRLSRPDATPKSAVSNLSPKFRERFTTWTPIAALRGGDFGGSAGFNAVLAYQLLKVMAGPMWVKLLCLAAVSYVLVLISASLLVCIGYTANWGHAMFQSYSILNKVPSSSSVHAEDPVHSFMLNAIYVLRFATFTVALSTVSSSINSAVQQTITGNHKKTSERGHILLINWSSATIPTLLQLESARKDGRKMSNVVVLSSKPKEEMDAELKERLGHVGIQVLTRQGDPATIRALDKVSAGTANMILVSIPDEIAGRDRQREELLATQMACLDILRQRRQPTRKVGLGERDVHVVVTAPFSPPQEVLNGASFCPRNDFVERLLALSALHPGLARVYQEILHSSSGSELYIRGIEAWPWLHGLNFWQAGKHFDRAVVLGWFERDDAAGEPRICLHPPRDQVIEEGYKLILLAKDSAIKCSRRGFRPAVNPLAMTFEAEESQPRRSLMSWNRGKKVLVLNFRHQTVLLQRLDETLPAGSVVDVQTCNPSIHVPRGRKGARFECCASAALSPSSALAFDWNSYDSCIVLQDSEPRAGSDVDARTLACISCGLEALRRQGGAGEEGKKLHLVVSLQKRKAKEVVQAMVQRAGVSVDTIEPELLESGALVQLLMSPQLQPVYNHLLSSTRSEIVFLEASAVVEPGSTVSFGHISALLEERGFLALGFRPFSGQLTLAPRQSAMLQINYGDRLVVMNAK